MNLRSRPFHLLLLLLGALLLAPVTNAAPAKYGSIVVFGDSLSDTGNDFAYTSSQGMTPAIPPSVSPYATYSAGHFTNGAVAVEYLWRLLARDRDAVITPSVTESDPTRKRAVSFAFGGSASGRSNPTPSGFLVPGVLGQVEQFAATLRDHKKAAPNALYVVWTGSNDYIQGITSSPDVVVGNIADAIRSLYELGARDFLVPNLPDMGLSPLMRAQGLGPQFTQLTQAHNALLNATLNSLAASLPKAKLVKVNVYALGQALVNSGAVIAELPAIEFLSPGTGAVDCLFRNPATCVDVPMPAALPPFLFWDVLHPTTQVHAAIGAAMFVALSAKKD
ncbi:SGNH/GDSL hydrolase family protein [soil metagenome]